VKKARAGESVAIRLVAAAALAAAGVIMAVIPCPARGFRDASRPAQKTARSLQREVVSFDDYWDVLGRRKYLAPPVPVERKDSVAQASAQELAKQVRFCGAMGSGDGVKALIAVKKAAPDFYAPGEKVFEFTLKSVTPEKIVLTVAGEDVEVYR